MTFDFRWAKTHWDSLTRGAHPRLLVTKACLILFCMLASSLEGHPFCCQTIKKKFKKDYFRKIPNLFSGNWKVCRTLKKYELSSYSVGVVSYQSASNLSHTIFIYYILCPSFAWWKTSRQRPCILVKKGNFHGSDGSLTGVPENVIDKWAFETRFVATRGIVSAFSSRDHLSSVMILHCCSVVA